MSSTIFSIKLSISIVPRTLENWYVPISSIVLFSIKHIKYDNINSYEYALDTSFRCMNVFWFWKGYWNACSTSDNKNFLSYPSLSVVYWKTNACLILPVFHYRILPTSGIVWVLNFLDKNYQANQFLNFFLIFQANENDNASTNVF